MPEVDANPEVAPGSLIVKARRLMDQTVFTLALQRLGTGGKSFEAARMVLCEGRRAAEAARICKTTRQSLYFAIKRIESAYENLGICPHCGHRIPPV